MNRQKYKAEYSEKIFVIKQDKPEVGWYLYVYENRRCIYDYLQGTLEITKEFAEEQFGVPLEKWEQIENDIYP